MRQGIRRFSTNPPSRKRFGGQATRAICMPRIKAATSLFIRTPTLYQNAPAISKDVSARQPFDKTGPILSQPVPLPPRRGRQNWKLWPLLNLETTKTTFRNNFALRVYNEHSVSQDCLRIGEWTRARCMGLSLIQAPLVSFCRSTHATFRPLTGNRRQAP